MSFKDPYRSLRDIADAIGLIAEFTAGMDFEAFRPDLKTVAAVERKLLIIGEAAIRLGDSADALCPGIPWRKVRGTGNWLRHTCDRIDLESVWATLEEDLPLLRTAVARALVVPASNDTLKDPS